MPSVLRLVLFAVLFAFLCIKGGELCSAGSQGLGAGLFADSTSRAPVSPPQPLRSRALEFRGLTPLPPMAGRVLPSLHPADR